MLSLAVVVLPAVVAYLVGTAAQAAPADGAADAVQVRSAVEIAAGLWLLGHGVPLTADDVTVSLAPLGIAVLALFTVYASAKRFAVTTLRCWAAGTLAYAAGTTGVALLAGSAPGWSLALAAVGGLVLGGLGTGLGLLARPGAPGSGTLGEQAEAFALRRTGRDLVPATLRLGLRAGTLATALLVGASALLVVAWAVAGRATSSDIITALEPGWTGGIVFAVAQLALLPNLVLWAASWLAGAGFAVGEGTSFTPFGTISGPLPAIPILGALPGEDWANAVSAWAPVLVVACGVAAGLFAWRRLEPELVRWPDVAWVLAGVLLTPGVLMLAGQWVAAGAGGPGRLSEVGANPLASAGLIAGEVVAGAVAVLVGAKVDASGVLERVRDRAEDARRTVGVGGLFGAADGGEPDGAADGAGPDGAADGAGPDGAADGAGPGARDAGPGGGGGDAEGAASDRTPGADEAPGFAAPDEGGSGSATPDVAAGADEAHAD